MEGRIALELLTQRLPNLRMRPGQTLDYTPNLTFRGPYELFVEWDVPPGTHSGGATL